MSDYLITGKKGTGKSKYVVQKIHEYLGKGRRVATNIDIDLAAMCKPMSRVTLIRLPDKPLIEDLELIGVGNDEVDEEKNGGLFLDECATWLNARTFNDSGRAGFIDFCIHGRKLGWDMYLLAQNMIQIDKQVRESLLEYVVKCMRLDKVKIPVIGGLISAITFGKLGKMKFHYASTRLMEMPTISIDGEYYKAKFYEKCYNTRQIFREWARDPADPRFKTEVYVGPYSVLSAWHLKGRYMTAQRKGLIETLLGALIDAKPFPVQPKYPPRQLPDHQLKLIELVRELPKEDRIQHFKRLQSMGLI